MNVWDAIADTPAEAADFKQRSALMMTIRTRISEAGWTHAVAAERLGWSEDRVADLLMGRISQFSLDELAGGAGRLGVQSGGGGGR